MDQEVPVYLFTGFLEAGKTRFIQETLEDERFNTDEESTLLLLCEEGEEEYDPSTFSGKKVFIEPIEQESDLSPKNLDRLLKKHACSRAVVEYNGMWNIDVLYQNMPENWLIYQEFFFVDARTFLPYNANLRNLVVDKLKSCEMVVFNRVPPDLDRAEIHKIVRGVSRRADIAYEDAEGNVEYDDIPDELPFDLEAPVVDIAPENYAVWYRDLTEETEKYRGKTVRVSGFAILRKDLPKNSFIFGRRVMTCCEADIQFAGLLCSWDRVSELNHRDWVEITAKISIRKSSVYHKEGPVLTVLDLKPGTAPEQDVATFY